MQRLNAKTNNGLQLPVSSITKSGRALSLRMEKPTVFIVDDDRAIRDALTLLIRSVGLQVKSYASAQTYLTDYDPQAAGCLLLDVRMPGMSGLHLQQHLVEHGSRIPVVILTGHGDVPMAVRAMKWGAADLIEKPFNDQLLLECIGECLEQDAARRREEAQQADLRRRLSRLSPREREVMDPLVKGECGKAIAAELGISPKTVDVHRAHILEKLQMRSVVELVRVVVAVEARSAELAKQGGTQY